MDLEMLILTILVSILFGIMFGPVVSVGVTPIFLFLRAIFFVPLIRDKLREEAIKNGHVVEATLQKYHTLRDKDGLSTTKEMGTYTYQVNGKKYKCHLVTSTGLPPSTTTLYYIKKPRKATSSVDLGSLEWPWLKFYLIISLIAAIISAVVMGIVLWSV